MTTKVRGTSVGRQHHRPAPLPPGMQALMGLIFPAHWSNDPDAPLAVPDPNGVPLLTAADRREIERRRAKGAHRGR